MKIYFLRHAIAVPSGTPGFPGDDRPLTDEGIKKMTKAAQGIKRVVDKLDLIATSPLKRAHDTAVITAKAMGYEKNVRITKHLLPNGNSELLFQELGKEKGLQSILLVGHEPGLGILVSKCLGAKMPAIEFKKGALCCIDVDLFPSINSGCLIWHLSPKQLRDLAN